MIFKTQIDSQKDKLKSFNQKVTLNPLIKPYGD